MSTPETIYLIPGEYEEGLVWCDDPAPDSYSDPDDAVKYVRADHIPDAGKVVKDNSKVNAGLIAENERLQAQVAELYDLIKYAQVDSGVCMCGNNMQDHNQASGHSPVDVWDHVVEQVDKENSFEAFILRKQAEAVQASRQDFESEPVGTARRCGYDRDITYCDFEADEVPIGTKLYTHTAIVGKQAVYSLVGHFYNQPLEGRIGIEWCCDSLDDGQELYAKQEQGDE